MTGPNDSRETPFGDGAGMLHDWISGAATEADLGGRRIDGCAAVVMGRESFGKNEGGRRLGSRRVALRAPGRRPAGGVESATIGPDVRQRERRP
ncbi:MAG: hypothetical protein J2P39_12075 [Candidatus Dormibacteraeota bacterium]|nr:hypothetical protein [Candidatus Dormibacteraeota bacterium]